MINYYQLSESNGIKKSDEANGNWMALQDLTQGEQEEIIERFQLPNDIFQGVEQAEEVSRLERLDGTKLKDAYILVVTNLSSETDHRIEKRLEPLIFILSDTMLITHVKKKSEFIDRLFEKYRDKTTSFEKLVAYVIMMVYSHYIAELLRIKENIDELDQAARKTTKNDELFKLADTERDVVYIDHTLKGQTKTLKDLWEKTDFAEELNDPKLIYDIEFRQQRAEQLIEIYRDLLETVGGLFSDMMDNNLNHLMKYLDSAALIISIPALVTGIWGMNTGGIPGEGSNLAFFLVLGLAAILSVLAAYHLSKKDYSK
ncbi:magnesium transporter CorA family protein [Enterococcus sp. 669A]|uniref:Magnesium transporter CorA family protein n=1 Tax=Candidatus Enterococcus moelleringii TaxID=2815325 RepID=A0ABS3LD66_9ENTE|nr:magnesium transporter CorA family protein [Enterococcus sp. 669A]MBO1307035.1 magnesium transporter CorA family protein [Enterococcus sp. 669A]